jgi:hypothetical protein
MWDRTGFGYVGFDSKDPLPNDPLNNAGLSINNAALYTSTVDVTLNIIAPPRATGMMISNDGGFAGAEVVPIQAAVSWKLVSSGPERLPRVVYLRFLGPTLAQTYTDDVILDQSPPTLSRVTGRACRKCVIPQNPTRAKFSSKYQLNLRAKDTQSGVVRMQVGPRKEGEWTPYQSKLTITGRRGQRIWLRVEDGAGNPSKWTSLLLKK